MALHMNGEFFYFGNFIIYQQNLFSGRKCTFIDIMSGNVIEVYLTMLVILFDFYNYN